MKYQIDSTVNVRGVLTLNETRTITVNNEEISLREGHIGDHSGSMLITLWRKYVNLLSGTTYEFLRLKKIKYVNIERLQTAHSTVYQVSMTPLQHHHLPEEPLVLELSNV